MSNLAVRVRHQLRCQHKIATGLLLWLGATPLAFLLRFDLTIPAVYHGALRTVLAGSAVVKLVAPLVFRFNLRSGSKVTFRDVEALLAGVLSVTAVQAALVSWLRPEVVAPASIPLLEAGVALALLFGVRAVRRVLDERRRRSGVSDASPVLIVGAGEAGALLAREMRRHPEAGLEPVAFVENDLGKLGQRIAGIEVMATARRCRGCWPTTGSSRS
jgi:FlaA1/EpsC-like NDP-sugar epimerase